MSNEITLFKDPKAVMPAHLQGSVDEVTRALMGSGSGNKRISIRGNVFRMIVDGKEVAKSDDRAMDIVVVNAAPKVSRSFYAGVYKEGEIKAPDCWSDDGNAPSPKSTDKQSLACATCPQNVKGSGQGESRACRYQQRLAVVLANDIEHSDIYQLTLPAQSIFGKSENGKMPLQAYSTLLGTHGIGVRNVVTEMRFDTDSATPKLFFRAVRPLTQEQYELVLEKKDHPDALNAISFNPAQLDGAKTAKAPEPLFQPTKEETPEPKVRASKAAATPAPKDITAVLEEWGDD